MGADEINPAHYKRFPVEVIQITEHLDFLLGNVVKYVSRAGHKPDQPKLRDLEKARWYLDRAIQNERETD